MQTINRQALAEQIHANAVAKGFWPTNEDGTYKHNAMFRVMLVITELSKAVEAERLAQTEYIQLCPRSRAQLYMTPGSDYGARLIKQTQTQQ